MKKSYVDLRAKWIVLLMVLFCVSQVLSAQVSLTPGTLTTIQAEDTTLSQAAIESDHSGYTGSGYVNYANQTGGYTQWEVNVPSDGPADCVFVFANGGGDRPMSVAVNGSVLSSYTFPGTTEWTNWTSANIAINLSSGNNTIRLTGTSSDGGPNMDRMEITFKGILIPPATPGDVNDDGIVNIVDALMTAQFYVGLNPTPFNQGAADVNCDKTVNIIDALMIAQHYVGLIGAFSACTTPLPTSTPTPVTTATPTPGPTSDSSVLIGWATQGGGTTGGGNTSAVNVSSLSELNSQAGGSSAKVIYVSGKLSGKLTVGSNKTIIGKPGTEIKNSAALVLDGSKNVIIKNITFIGTPDGSSDTALITGGSNIWLDHCEFVDGGDGMLDIVHGSNYITISWCKMRYTEKTGHQNAMLLSHSDSAGDDGKIKVTYHHNWWAENIAERQPRVRFGQVHIFNNLYVATPGFTSYAIRAGYKANIRSESNIFRDFTGQSVAASDAKNDMGECLVFNYAFNKNDSILQTINDVFINCTDRGIDADDVEGGTFGNGTAFVPPYQYSQDSTSGLEAAIRAGAGPQ